MNFSFTTEFISVHLTMGVLNIGGVMVLYLRMYTDDDLYLYHVL